MIWREKRLLLIVLGILLAANAVFFFTYRVRYERRLQDIEDRREQAEGRLIASRSARLAAERRVGAYRAIQRDIDTIYNEQWSTRAERLTAMISEVKRLEIASGLIPQSTAFGQQSMKKTTAATVSAARDQRRAEMVTVSFSVHGTYQQVRRFINLLELSRQFLIIERIGLSSADAQGLTLTLQLKTVFRDTTPQGGRDL